MNSNGKRLLSIDVNGHLRKLALHSHRSHHHYPVELIRCALQRGATRIVISINKEMLDIQDNGGGIGQEALSQLSTLMDPGRPAAEREEAIHALRNPIGIGLISIFSPAPERITIEDNNGVYSTRVQFQRQTLTSVSGDFARGTRMIITRSAPEYEEEIAAIKDYCREVDQEIILNRKPLEKEPVIQHPIASTILNANKYYKKAHISVTQEGDVCKIWLTDQRIPWGMKTYPPISGFIFDAVIETGGQLSDSVFQQLAAASFNLYRWMCKRFNEYPESYRERIEDLLFKHNRLTGDNSLINTFSPFQILGSTYKMSLREIKEMATGKGVPVLQIRYAEKYSHITGHKANILVLKPKQIDFLGNHHHVPLRLIIPNKQEGKTRQWLIRAGRFVKETLRRLHPRYGDVLAPANLAPAERSFLAVLQTALSGSADNGDVEVVMVNARGLLPHYRKKSQLSGAYDGAPLTTLYIPRLHPLVHQAVRAVEIDAANIALALPALGISPKD